MYFYKVFKTNTMNINIEKVKLSYKELTGDKLPLHELAKELGITNSTLTNWIDKDVGLPKAVDCLSKLSKKTGLSINEIIE